MVAAVVFVVAVAVAVVAELVAGLAVAAEPAAEPVVEPAEPVAVELAAEPAVAVVVAAGPVAELAAEPAAVAGLVVELAELAELAAVAAGLAVAVADVAAVGVVAVAVAAVVAVVAAEAWVGEPAKTALGGFLSLKGDEEGLAGAAKSAEALGFLPDCGCSIVIEHVAWRWPVAAASAGAAELVDGLVPWQPGVVALQAVPFAAAAGAGVAED